MFIRFAVRMFVPALVLLIISAPLRAQEYSVGTGEIRFDGTLISHDAAARSLVMNVVSFTLPSGKSSTLAKPKAKTILLSKGVIFLITGQQSETDAPAFLIGKPITAIGPDVGSAKTFSARLVTWEDAEPSTPATSEVGNPDEIDPNEADPNEVKIKAGETRFDGKLTGILSETSLTVSIFTSTNAKGVTTDISPSQSKAIALNAATLLRSRGDFERKLKFDNLKIGQRLTFAGKLAGNNVQAREIAVWENNESTSESIGSVVISRAVSILIGQADQAHSAKAFEETIKLLNQAIEAADVANDRPGRALALGRLGNAYGEIKQLQKGVEAYESALSTWRNLGNVQNESTTLNNLGLLLGNNGEIEKAVPILEKSVELGRDGDPRGLALSLQNLAEAYSAQKKFDKSLEALVEALPIVRKNKNADEAGILSARIAELYGILKKPEQALKYAELTEQIIGEMPGKEAQAAALYSLGSAYLILNRKAKGLEHYKSALAIYTELDSKEDAESLAEEIAEIEKAR